MRFRALTSLLLLRTRLLSVFLTAAFFRASAAEPPRLVEQGGRYALLVDG
jgi:hypothetical protein